MNFQMDQFMLVNGRIIYGMEKDNIILMMDHFMKVNGKMINRMVLVG